MEKKDIFFKADKDYGSRVAQGLGLDVKEVEGLTGMNQEERAKLQPNT